MRGHEELVTRLALKRRRKLKTMSDEAFGELEIAVRENPQNFIDDAEEQAFYIVVQALSRYESSLRDEDLMDDEAFMKSRRSRFAMLKKACDQALELDERCVDAGMLSILASDEAPAQLLEDLMDFMSDIAEYKNDLRMPASGDAWTDVFLHPYMRLQMAVTRTCVNTAHFRWAVNSCAEMLRQAPLDVMGARFTCALAMARLEDEKGFRWLESREGQHGHSSNAWFHLSRAILMYKLGRIPAARRALMGYDRLCTGGAYLLLQPMYVDTYMPDRPEFAPGSFRETVLAVHEADPVLADVPDFANWACRQPGFLDSAHDYCSRNGLEWREW